MAHNKSSSSRHFPDLVTYRYNGVFMYVPLVKSHPQALSHARNAFPQLKKIKDSSLTLCLTVKGQKSLVGISAAAWPIISSHLSRYEVIDVQVDAVAIIPNITITAADCSEAAPVYRGRCDVVDVEKLCADLPAPPRASSPSLPNPAKLSPKWIMSKLNGP